MKKTASILVLAGLLAGAAPAAAKSVTYVGKTSGGHKITFKLRGSKIINPITAVPVTCLPIGRRRPQLRRRPHVPAHQAEDGP